MMTGSRPILTLSGTGAVVASSSPAGWSPLRSSLTSSTICGWAFSGGCAVLFAFSRGRNSGAPRTHTCDCRPERGDPRRFGRTCDASLRVGNLRSVRAWTRLLVCEVAWRPRAPLRRTRGGDQAAKKIARLIRGCVITPRPLSRVYQLVGFLTGVSRSNHVFTARGVRTDGCISRHPSPAVQRKDARRARGCVRVAHGEGPPRRPLATLPNPREGENPHDPTGVEPRG